MFFYKKLILFFNEKGFHGEFLLLGSDPSLYIDKFLPLYVNMNGKSMNKKLFALGASITALFSSVLVAPAAANAQGCQGVTASRQIASDFDNKMQWRETKLNSCDTQKALDQLHQASGGAALGGLIGVAIPSIGAASALVGVWAWQNQDAFKGCADQGRGVTFVEANGAIMDCRPQ